MFEKLTERYTRIFERPSPVISCDKQAIETSSQPGFLDGYFIIKNTGGGNLEGEISADSSLIKFSNNLIEGNDVIVEYEIDLSRLNPGETFKCRIFISTNGGRHVIPVHILAEPYGIKCGRFLVQTLKDFEGCAKAFPAEAAALFASPEFEAWLIKSKCEHMELYRVLASGKAGIREMDCFLTVCGLKERASLKTECAHLTVSIPFGAEETAGTIKLSTTSWGYFEYNVRTLGDSPWLYINKKKITNTDVKKDELLFEFKVITSEMKGVRLFETIVLESGSDSLSINITAQKPKPFSVSLSRRSYRSEDAGFLIVENHTGKNAMLEIAALESFIRFRAAKYLVTERTEIPFEIKVNSFLNLGIGRKPVNVSDVICRAVIDGEVYRETLTVKAGSLVVG